MEFKKVYTKTELAELVAWFSENREKLPSEIQLNSSTASFNLLKTVDAIVALIEENGTNPTFGGQIKILFNIREKLIKDGME